MNSPSALTSGRDNGLKKTLKQAKNIRGAVEEMLVADAAQAAQIRNASDRVLAVADQTHKHPLLTRAQIENWETSHVDETRQYVLDAAKAWRTAAVAHEHALDMYDVATETDSNGMNADTQGLRNVADSLRTHASRLKLIDKRYENPTLQASIYACNEAIARINEKHTVIAARLNDTANRLLQVADDYDVPRTDRKIAVRPRPTIPAHRPHIGNLNDGPQPHGRHGQRRSTHTGRSVLPSAHPRALPRGYMSEPKPEPDEIRATRDRLLGGGRPVRRRVR